MLNGDHIKGSPFACHVFDPQEIDVEGLGVGVVGKELTFTVDARRGGDGKLTVRHME